MYDCDWLSFLADRIPRYFHFEDTANITKDVIHAIENCDKRDEVQEVVKAIQHYYCQLYFWIDLIMPWNEMGVAYAKALNDPVQE